MLETYWEKNRQTRIELTNILESILRQLRSENVDENVVDSVQYRLDWIFNIITRYAEQLRLRRTVFPYDVERFLKFADTLSRFDVLTGLAAVTPDYVVACDSL